MAKHTVIETLKFNNIIKAAKLDFNDKEVKNVYNAFAQNKDIDQLNVEVKTYHNTVKDFVTLMGQQYLWDQIDHVVITDYTGDINKALASPQGNILYETISSQRINHIRSNPYILAYMIYGPDASSRTGDGTWGSIGLCDSADREFNSLKIPLTKYSNEVVFLQFRLESI